MSAIQGVAAVGSILPPLLTTTTCMGPSTGILGDQPCDAYSLSGLEIHPNNVGAVHRQTHKGLNLLPTWDDTCFSVPSSE
ncbi:hypothetical protein XELAEV_18010102mg [Xenopus laevis]|uniref:Uncharacterized protein n=1 Tax=Xenopus laevis TaxID=8355 RepID=A0A974DUR0_XENLA|nr:hypothetical protein XELAEV_18010102mg [Xenopus laevis]